MLPGVSGAFQVYERIYLLIADLSFIILLRPWNMNNIVPLTSIFPLVSDMHS